MLDSKIPETRLNALQLTPNSTRPSEYFIEKSYLDSCLFNTAGQIHSFKDWLLPIAVVNITDSEIIITEGSQLRKVESCDGIKYAASVVDHLGKELDAQVLRYLNQKNNINRLDDNQNTGNKKETNDTSD